MTHTVSNNHVMNLQCQSVSNVLNKGKLLTLYYTSRSALLSSLNKINCLSNSQVGPAQHLSQALHDSKTCF